MSVNLLTEHYLEFLSLTGGCTGSSQSTLVKMPHCWKSHVAAHIYLRLIYLTLFILLDFPMHFGRISMVLSIMYFKGSQVEISKIVSFLS